MPGQKIPDHQLNKGVEGKREKSGELPELKIASWKSVRGGTLRCRQIKLEGRTDGGQLYEGTYQKKATQPAGWKRAVRLRAA